jgi:HSP20 family protein
MRQTRWQSFSPLWNQVQQLQNEMNHLFNRWSDGGGLRGLVAAFPPVNIWEDAESVFVEAELPGMDPKDLEIHITGGNHLTLKGDRKPQNLDKGVVHRQERGYGAFSRVVALPFHVDADKVDAHFENGVLLVKLGKHEAAKPRKINVKGE